MEEGQSVYALFRFNGGGGGGGDRIRHTFCDIYIIG